MIKKQIALAITTVAVVVFSGCGDDRSHPKGLDENGNPITYKNPTAVIDLNHTTNQYVPALGEYTVDRANLSAPFIFTGTRSHDNDENNQSISSYVWAVTHTFSNACVDVDTSANRAVFKFVHTDTNGTCATEATDNGEINATLTVTDNENKSDSTTKTIKTN